MKKYPLSFVHLLKGCMSIRDYLTLVMDTLWVDIPEAKNWQWVYPIFKGWSLDKKYFVQHRNGEKYLLRLFAPNLMEEEKPLYEALGRWEYTIPNVSRFIGGGYCAGGRYGYRFFTWVEGIEAGEILKAFPIEKQYKLGIEAGGILSKIHQIPAPKARIPWATFYAKKIDRNLRRYSDCGVKVPQMDFLIAYVEKNREKIEGRPQSFNHGDYHVGNMVINPYGELGIIDFNRLDFGDPWVEFERITWCAALSPHFASGMIHGYFNYQIPVAFFPLMALYIASNQLGGIYWTQLYDPTGLPDQINRTVEIIHWYRAFSVDIPCWYLADPPQ